MIERLAYRLIGIREILKAFFMGGMLMTVFHNTAEAQTLTAAEYQVKAVFLYNFTHFIEWPSTAFESPTSPFIIGIVGKDPFGPYLEQAIAGERVEGREMQIVRYSSNNTLGKCHLLFVNLQDPDDIRKAVEKAGSKSVVTVGDSPNFIRWGGMIRFYTEESKIRLEINNTLAKSRQLQISSKLLRVAIVQ